MTLVISGLATPTETWPFSSIATEWSPKLQVSNSASTTTKKNQISSNFLHIDFLVFTFFPHSRQAVTCQPSLHWNLSRYDGTKCSPCFSCAFIPWLLKKFCLSQKTFKSMEKRYTQNESCKGKVHHPSEMLHDFRIMGKNTPFVLQKT